jgi:hypothetical protein
MSRRRIRVAKSKRHGLGKGTGSGYRNLIPKDPKVHSDSGKGIKQPQTFIAGNMPPMTPIMSQEERDAIDKPLPEIEQSFADEYGMVVLKALKEKVGEIKDIRFGQSANNGYGHNVTIIEGEDGSEWEMFESEEDAEDIARQGVENDLDNEPELFNQDWLDNFITMSDTDRRIIADEEATAEIESMSDDEIVEAAGKAEEYAEMQEALGETDSKGDANDIQIEIDTLIDRAKEDLHDEKYDEIYDELKDPIEYFVNDRGIYSREDLLKQSFITIDTEVAAEDAISTDGWQHFLATYDGQSIDLPNGRVMVRIN